MVKVGVRITEGKKERKKGGEEAPAAEAPKEEAPAAEAPKEEQK